MFSKHKSRHQQSKPSSQGRETLDSNQENSNSSSNVVGRLFEGMKLPMTPEGL